MSEKTQHGNTITRSFIGSYSLFWAMAKDLTRLYDNGYTAAYYDDNKLLSYCEGDLVEITGVDLESEKIDHLNYFNENC